MTTLHGYHILGYEAIRCVNENHRLGVKYEHVEEADMRKLDSGSRRRNTHCTLQGGKSSLPSAIKGSGANKQGSISSWT